MPEPPNDPEDHARAHNMGSRVRAKLLESLTVVLLLALYFYLGFTAAQQKTPTFDEPHFYMGGWNVRHRGDYHILPEGGLFTELWATAPESFAPHPLQSISDHDWTDANASTLCHSLLYRSETDVDAMIGGGRLMIGILGLFTGLVIYSWSRQLFGALGGLISLAAFVTSPTILANNFLVTADATVSLFFLLATWALWVFLQRVSVWTLFAAILAISGLVLSKFSGVFLIAPVSALLLIARLCNPAPLPVRLGRWHTAIAGRGPQLGIFAIGAVVIAISVWGMIWGAYGFRFAASPANDEIKTKFVKSWSFVDQRPELTARAVVWAREHRLLPEAFIYGMAYVGATTQKRPAFFNGDVSMTGWRTFFPYCVAVKTPVEFFVLLLAGVAALCLMRRGKAPPAPSGPNSPQGASSMVYQMAPLLILLAVYWAVAIKSHINIGHRHIMPTYPPMFILAGSAAWWFSKASGMARRIATAARVVVAASLTLLLVEAVGYWPDYLAYFNFAAGGPSQGYRHLIDSSLDWGQDLAGLKRWLRDLPPGSPDHVYLSYFGSARPDYYQIEARTLPSFMDHSDQHTPEFLTGGIYCVSASMLQCLYLNKPGRWNAEFENDYQAKRTIFSQLREGNRDLETLQRILSVSSNEEAGHWLADFESLRFSRLCSFLRRREPDAQIGHSILIYRLSDEEVNRALEGPPVELLEQPDDLH